MRSSAFFATLVVGAAASMCAAREVKACGGCFHSPNQVATVVTDHRMIFRITPQATTLYDEIEYQGDPTDFAWVLPIQGPVEVGLSSDVLFSALDQATQTTIVPPAPPVCQTCPFCGSNSSGGGFYAPSASADAGAAVTVISQSVVGPYETVQLQSSDQTALETWLASHGYVIPADIAPVVQAYIQEGFDFLALRLLPGLGVQAMRPVRVTTPGAGLTLPLRMVAAGTGATVGITLWVVADGRYEPANFTSFTIDPSTITWDFSTSSSNYASLRSSEEAMLNYAAWQVESSIDVSPYTIEGPVLNGTSSQDYLPVPASDAGGDGGAGETADQVRQDDLAVLFPNQSSVRVTRMRGDLSHAALANDLVLTASTDATLSNFYNVTMSVNTPTCPVVTCTPCSPSSSGIFGGSSGGSSGIFGGTSGGSSSSGGHGSGCAVESGSESGAMDLVVMGVAGVAFVGARTRRRR
jgi:uncharacterized membrane protein YgcG